MALLKWLYVELKFHIYTNGLKLIDYWSLMQYQHYIVGMVLNRAIHEYFCIFVVLLSTKLCKALSHFGTIHTAFRTDIVLWSTCSKIEHNMSLLTFIIDKIIYISFLTSWTACRRTKASVRCLVSSSYKLEL